MSFRSRCLVLIFGEFLLNVVPGDVAERHRAPTVVRSVGPIGIEVRCGYTSGLFIERFMEDSYQCGPYPIRIHSRSRVDQISILFRIHSRHPKGGNDQRERSRAAAKGGVVPALCE